MKIYCVACNLYLGDIVAGSKLRKNILHVCGDCAELYNLIDYGQKEEPKSSNGDATVDYLKKMFRMK